MARRREGLSRKQTYGVSLREEEHAALLAVGGGSLSVGVAWLLDTVLERDPDKPEFRHVLEVRAAFEQRQRELATTKAAAAADLECAKAAKKAAKGPSKAERELAEAVAHYDSINAHRIANGQPLYDMSHLSRNTELVAAVYANARAKYGWEKGLRPVPSGPALPAPGPHPGELGSIAPPAAVAPTENMQPEFSSMQTGNNSAPASRPDRAESEPGDGEVVQEPQF